jgi:hypothetical protein
VIDVRGVALELDDLVLGSKPFEADGAVPTLTEDKVSIGHAFDGAKQINSSLMLLAV